jgi:hypothetical protein
MKSKNKTGVAEQSRQHKTGEKQTATSAATKHVRNQNSRQEDLNTDHGRGYYSRNGGHTGYNGL